MFLGDAETIVGLCCVVVWVLLFFNLLYYVIWWLITPVRNTNKLPEKLPRYLRWRSGRLTFFVAGKNVAYVISKYYTRVLLERFLEKRKRPFRGWGPLRGRDMTWSFCFSFFVLSNNGQSGMFLFTYFHTNVNTVILIEDVKVLS